MLVSESYEATCPVLYPVIVVFLFFFNAGSLSVYHCVEGPYAFGMYKG